MEFSYHNITLHIDNEIIKKRKERFEDTDQDIIEFVEPYLDCEYGDHIREHIERVGLEKIERNINNYLMTDIELTDPVESDPALA